MGQSVSTWEAEIRRIGVQGQHRQIVYNTSSLSNQRKMGWRCDSSSGVPALQMQGSVLKFQSYQQKKKEKVKENYLLLRTTKAGEIVAKQEPL
jgi:hypothetical protein